MKTDSNCIFCKIVAKDIPADLVYEDDLTLAFLDNSPINPGHTLLIPKSHKDHLWDLEKEDYHYIMDTTKKIQSALQKTYSPPKVGLVVEGFGVAHAHLHVIPIYSSEDLNKPHIPTDTNILDLEAKKIRANL